VLCHEGILGEWKCSSTYSSPQHQMEVNGQLHALTTLPPGKEPRFLLDRHLSGPQSWSGHGNKEKNSQSLPGLILLIIQPIAQLYTTELSWLLS